MSNAPDSELTKGELDAFIKDNFGGSAKDFADWLGVHLRTVQNWRAKSAHQPYPAWLAVIVRQKAPSDSNAALPDASAQGSRNRASTREPAAPEGSPADDVSVSDTFASIAGLSQRIARSDRD